MASALVYCDKELETWIKQLTSEFNKDLPVGKQLSQKDVTRLLPRLFTARTVRLNIILEKPRNGRHNPHQSRIREYEEFLI